nr:hypothetical protein [Escherichia coli]
MHLPAAWVAALPGIVDILLLSTLLYPVQWISTTPGSVRPKNYDAAPPLQPYTEYLVFFFTKKM